MLWVGTDDGNVQMSRDGGKTWTNVVSHVMGLPKGGYVSRIEPSHKEAGTAYITFDNHRSADYGIYIFMTKNYGDSFTKITNGIPPEAGTVHVIREDPVNPNLLFAGTEFGMFVSFDGRELASHEERTADRAGVRHSDSSARARSDSGDARPLDLDHGQHHRAGADDASDADERT